ncbi:DUF4342 domain-containing protein [Paramaledivibacter caminithermalis]|uniref:DUF4342 domain-containing protein n=1 Tax=Paramaledivibacter caminithermalis (strain DSM 15212 / CIP 107654 / DViRD3) TaxID=1121301 RepID=A0A1M6P8A7_PARC5|nr:DUF4342 domain-containing protein [Paramaledivibacter caminithermalis]SHK04142.1 protein of unknown function [Paramaledivibacter caminithermalis DSM 15212]
MKVTLEQIDLLRKRANVSYEDAKEALEKFEGDIVEALVYLEKENKIKSKDKRDCRSDFWERLKSIIKKGNKTKFVIKNNKNTVINIPLTLAIIVTVFATPFVIIGLIAALLTKHRISIIRVDGENLEVNKVIDKMTSAVNDMASQSQSDKNENKKDTEQ